jgi:hypothetical protein
MVSGATPPGGFSAPAAIATRMSATAITGTGRPGWGGWSSGLAAAEAAHAFALQVGKAAFNRVEAALLARAADAAPAADCARGRLRP